MAENVVKGFQTGKNVAQYDYGSLANIPTDLVKSSALENYIKKGDTASDTYIIDLVKQTFTDVSKEGA